MCIVCVCVDVWTLEHFNVERWIILWNVSPITQLYNPIRYCFMRLVWHKMIHENSFKINFSQQCGKNFQGEPKSDGLLKFGRNENSASESCLLNTKCINFDALISVSYVNKCVWCEIWPRIFLPHSMLTCAQHCCNQDISAVVFSKFSNILTTQPRPARPIKCNETHIGPWRGSWEICDGITLIIFIIYSSLSACCRLDWFSQLFHIFRDN